MDAVEADGTVYIMTEHVKPLSAELPSWEGKHVNDRQDWLLWGLHRITVRTECSRPVGTGTRAPFSVRPRLLLMPTVYRTLFHLSTLHAMLLMAPLASAPYSFLLVVNGSLVVLNSSVILRSQILSSLCVFYSVIPVNAAPYQGS